MRIRSLLAAAVLPLAACQTVPPSLSATPPGALAGAGAGPGPYGAPPARSRIIAAQGKFAPQADKQCKHNDPCVIDIGVEDAACLNDPDPAAACTFTFAGTIETRNGTVDIEWVLPGSFRFCPTFSGASAKDGIFVHPDARVKSTSALTGCEKKVGMQVAGKSGTGTSEEWIPYVLAFRWDGKPTVVTIDPWIVNR